MSIVSELSIFIDESGDTGSGTGSRHYLFSLVQHDQGTSIERDLAFYKAALAQKGLPDLPFHMGPLMTGHEAYAGLSLETRKALFHTFRVAAERMPVNYHVFAYRKDAVEGGAPKLAELMKRDLILFFFQNLAFFQSFDAIKVYYDNGQGIVTDAIRSTAQCMLAKNVVVYRDAHPQDYFLCQLADYVCGIELTAVKYEHGEQTKTDQIFFGDRRNFKKNILKPIRRLAM
jgi:hypothetical protein